MNHKRLLNLISMMEFEASTSLPIEELERFDNNENIKFIKRQGFKQKASLNKEKYSLILNKISEKTRQKIDDLQSLTLEALLDIIQKREISFQFRNLENLDENQIREIISDLYLLDELKDEE